MTQFPTDWHPSWITYEWWGDIGTGLLSFLAAAVIGGITVTIAIRSHILAGRSVREAKDRAERDTADRYRDQLVRVVEPAVGDLVAYGNLIDAAKMVNTDEERQVRAGVLSRLILVDAVAQGEDRALTSAIIESFSQGSRVLRHGWIVRVQIAGRLAGALAGVVGKQNSHDELLADIKGAVANEEKKADAAVQAQKNAEAEAAQ
ncbi:hypothetical protein EDF42_2143 [Curtobacterium sp. PhB172]|uniref:hypothetical protein n=2 Tax=unclassified Curtobacterium TaxID=257496 RepID=UPI000F4D0EEB|nr:hypothetical protein [Curtobacterium sp. PhB172]ROS63889.1 hypothetical protein EDF42_2143 [Curtobacterium sp. PhB172]